VSGIVLGIAAIIGEEIGLWNHPGGRLFLLLVVLLFVTPLAIFLWSRSHYVLRDSA
jgi:hypothetical protein